MEEGHKRMNQTTEILLERYEPHMEDNDLFYAIFDYLPTSYQYQVIMNLLEYDEYLKPGNTLTGEKQEGIICIRDMCILLVDVEGGNHVLCALPQPFDI